MKKKILTVAIAIISATAAFAQVNVGLGYAGASQNLKVADEMYRIWFNGFAAEVGYNLPLGLGFEFVPSVQFVYMSDIQENANGDGLHKGSSEFTYAENYLNVPLMFNYGYDVNFDCRLFVYAGPTVSFGLYSYTKSRETIATKDGSTATSGEKFAVWDKESTYSRYDVRIGGGVGVDVFDNYRFKVGYDYGLLDRATTDLAKMHYHYLNVGFAYLF